jgi:hypothetical protein
MTWKTYTCQVSNRPAMVLVDDRFANQAPLSQLPYLSWFGVYCSPPIGNGLWNPAESDCLDEIEDDLIKLCGAFGHGWVVYVLRIATPGIREYYLYQSGAAELDKAFLALKANHHEYRIEIDRLNDPDWRQYKKYVSYEPKLPA